MVKKYIYLGTWFQRTSLHLKEVYLFLKNKKVILGLDEKKLAVIWDKSNLDSVILHEETDFDYVEFHSKGIRTIITEDGVILIRSDFSDDFNRKYLENFYVNLLAPVLSELFSLGAPIPKELKSAKDIYPIFYVGENMTAKEKSKFFAESGEAIYSVVKNEDVEISFAGDVAVLDFQNSWDQDAKEEFLRNLVFFREFEMQLNNYLNLHRHTWDKVANIRKKSSLRFRDFHVIRETMLHYLNTMSFAKARLAQMGDILSERAVSTKIETRNQLDTLGLNRFEFLKADQKYIGHLSQMTMEYINGTLNLLSSLYEESTQRELSTLKFVTFIGVVTSFFGMNIAFPWEERWESIAAHSLGVIILIAIASLTFYFSLKFFIHNRRFTIKDDESLE